MTVFIYASVVTHACCDKNQKGKRDHRPQGKEGPEGEGPFGEATM
jgi:hypothetical protein